MGSPVVGIDNKDRESALFSFEDDPNDWISIKDAITTANVGMLNDLNKPKIFDMGQRALGIGHNTIIISIVQGYS